MPQYYIAQKIIYVIVATSLTIAFDYSGCNHAIISDIPPIGHNYTQITIKNEAVIDL